MTGFSHFRTFPALCAVLLFVLAACGGNPLIGSWHSDKGQSWTFDSDSVKSNIPQLAGQNVKVSYKNSGDDVSVVPANGSPLTFRVVDRDTVTYNDPITGTVTLHRNK